MHSQLLCSNFLFHVVYFNWGSPKCLWITPALWFPITTSKPLSWKLSSHYCCNLCQNPFSFLPKGDSVHKHFIASHFCFQIQIILWVSGSLEHFILSIFICKYHRKCFVNLCRMHFVIFYVFFFFFSAFPTFHFSFHSFHFFQLHRRCLTL